MFSKFLINRNFCQTLKQRKEALTKNKKIENAFKKNQNKIEEVELESIMQKYNFKTLMIRLGLVFSVAPCIYYYYKKTKYPIYSKELTDSYNSCLNLISYSNTLYVN